MSRTLSVVVLYQVARRVHTNKQDKIKAEPKLNFS